MTHATRSLLLAGLSSFALATPAMAQTNPQAEQNAQAQQQAQVNAQGQNPVSNEQTIIVTGTRTANRTVANSPVPVDVIGADQIKNTGATETNKILNQLVPSFNFPQPSINDGSDAIRPATLRGLSPDQTLVLINGKRRHVSALLNINGTVGRGSAAVDLNLIPGIAISRVEVLRDGAAAQYGSDAIAGVINIQLKNSNHGGRASVTWGEYLTQLDDVMKLSGLQTNAAGQPILDASTNNNYFLANYDGERKVQDGAQVTAAVNVGLPLGARGFVNLSGEYHLRQEVNRAGYDIRPNYLRPTSTTFDSRELAFDRLQFRFGDPRSHDYNLLLNSGFDITPDWQLYAFGTYGHRNALSAANWRQESNNGANRDFSVLAPNQTPTFANYVGLTPDGFLPLIDTHLRDYAVTVGARGDIAGWKVDLSVGRGHDKFDYQVHNTVNASFGPQTQRDFDAGGLRYAQNIANLDVSRDYEVGFAKPLTVAAGAEYRHEQFKERPGDLQSYAIGPYFRASFPTTSANCTTQQGVFNSTTGICSFPGRQALAGAQGFPGIPESSRTNAKRHSYAAYAELDTDPIEGLTTTLAGRYEHFSDFGSTWNGKFAARYEFIRGYAVRGAISNGFRAPSLHQQFFTTTSTNFLAGVPVDIATLAVNAPAAVALGAQPLKPEKSVNLSLGATANPFRGLTFTADYYHIKIKDRIVFSENLTATRDALGSPCSSGTGCNAIGGAIATILNNNGFNSLGAARFFLNGLDTTTHGIDLVATYRVGLDQFGKWNLSAAYNYTKTRIDKRLNNLGPLTQIPGIILFGRTEGIRFTDGQPRDKVVLNADGDIGKFGITARTTRYGKVISPGTAAPIAPNQASLTAIGPDDIFLSAKWITDFEGRIHSGPAEFAIGVNNVFDVYPDRSPFGPRPASAGGGQYPANQIYLPYSTFSPFGFDGRFIYARAAVNF